MSSTGCIICNVDTSNKKYKKFHGASYKKAYDIIDDMIHKEFYLTIYTGQSWTQDEYNTMCEKTLV